MVTHSLTDSPFPLLPSPFSPHPPSPPSFPGPPSFPTATVHRPQPPPPPAPHVVFYLEAARKWETSDMAGGADADLVWRSAGCLLISATPSASSSTDSHPRQSKPTCADDAVAGPALRQLSPSTQEFSVYLARTCLVTPSLW